MNFDHLKENYLDFHSHTVQPTDQKFVIRSLFLQDQHLFENKDHLLYTIGLHPWHADLLKEDQIKDLYTKYDKNEKIIAFGEAGLDKIRGASWNNQMDAFIAQIKISLEFDRSLIIHSVQTHNEILKLHKEFKPSKPWVIHLYTGSEQMAFDFINHGFYLSLGHQILNQKSRISSYYHKLPVDKIFFESDDFDISIEELYNDASRKFELSLLNVKKQMINNLNTFINGK